MLRMLQKRPMNIDKNTIKNILTGAGETLAGRELALPGLINETLNGFLKSTRSDP